MVIIRTCPFCGTVTEVEVDKKGCAQYTNGALVQDAFPNLTATEREVIISGICPACQDTLFGDEDED